MTEIELQQVAEGLRLAFLVVAFLAACLFWRWYRMCYPRGWLKMGKLVEARREAEDKMSQEGWLARRAKQEAHGFAYCEQNPEQHPRTAVVPGWRVYCPRCGGYGNDPLTDICILAPLRAPPKPCNVCKGKGWVDDPHGLPKPASYDDTPLDNGFMREPVTA